jgi:hypothetical protein
MKLFLLLASTFILVSCQDIVGPEATNLNFRAPNSVDEREAKLSYTYEQQMSDRAYVESVLLQVFDAAGKKMAPIIQTEIYQKIEFGGACDIYAPSDVSASAVEFAREQCFNGIGVVQGSNNNPMRYSLTTKVCEKLVKDSDSLGAVRKKIFAENVWKKPTPGSIQTAWNLFYQVHRADPMVVEALLGVAEASVNEEDAWRNIILTMCISPDWQAL